MDVSDGAYLARALLAGGPAPACDAAVNLVPDSTVNLGDVPAIWYSVGAKSAPYRPTVTAEDCPLVERGVEPPCGDGLALGVDAPAQATGSGAATFSATVTITSPAVAVEAWSFTLQATGCTIDAGTSAGTDAADVADGTGGLRADGVAWQSVTPAEAQVLTVLDWRTQATLPVGGARAVHTFTVSGTPTASCAPCTLTLVPGDAATGVESVVSAEGWRYVPALGGATIGLCEG